MIKVDPRFKDSIDARTKTATFRDAPKYVTGEIHALVNAENYDQAFGNVDYIYAWVRITDVRFTCLGEMESEEHGFKDWYDMYDYAKELYFPDSPEHDLWEHTFEYVEEPTP